MFPLFYHFFRSIGKIFSGKNLWWHALAIVLTFILVTTGFDWWYYSYFHHSAIFRFLFTAAIAGFFVPVLVPVILLVAGYLSRRFTLINTGWALGQAALLGLLVSSFYKVFTGRPGPPFRHGGMPVKDTSRIFRFGILRGGVFWGWPSSHTTVAFAMSFALFNLFPGNKWIRTIAVLYAFYIGIGVSMTIHWFSDFVAGAIVGFVIGKVIGQTFLEREKMLPHIE